LSAHRSCRSRKIRPTRGPTNSLRPVLDAVSERTQLPTRRLVFVLNSYDIGGAEKRASLVARLLQERGTYDTQIVALRETGSLRPYLQGAGIPSSVLPFEWRRCVPALLKRVLRLAAGLRTFRPDAILSYTVVPNTACALAWRLAGAKTMVWNQTNAGHTAYLERWQRLAIQFAPFCTSNTEAGAAYLRDGLRASPSRVRVIRNAVLPEPYTGGRDAFRDRLALTQGDFVACMVANIRHPKDHTTLIRAWRLVVDDLACAGRRAVLLLAGGLSESAFGLKALAFDLGLHGYVRFVGLVQDVDGLLRASDLGLLITASESGSHGLVEAMAAGLPVIASDIPGNREVVGEDMSDCLVPGGDYEALAHSICQVAYDANLRQRCIDRSLRRVSEAFSAARMVDEVNALLTDALDGRSRSRWPDRDR